MHLKQNLFFSLLKSKNWRETQSFFGFPLHRSKTVLSIFGSFYNTVYEEGNAYGYLKVHANF